MTTAENTIEDVVKRSNVDAAIVARGSKIARALRVEESAEQLAVNLLAVSAQKSAKETVEEVVEQGYIDTTAVVASLTVATAG